METPQKLLDSWIAAATENPILSLGRRTSIVGRIKYLIGILVMVLVASLILWPLLYPVDQPLKLTFSALESKPAEPSKMIKPRFHGIDKYNRPFNIRADEAYQKDDAVVALKNINGDLAMQDGNWLMVSASGGEVTVDGKSLELHGNVNLFSSDGYEIRTEKATADLISGTAKGADPITCQGPLGLLQATGFFVDAYNEKLVFNGRVKVTIYPPARSNKK